MCVCVCVFTDLKKAKRSYGHLSTCYRAINQKDGLYYCLRRIHGEWKCVQCMCKCVCGRGGQRYGCNIPILIKYVLGLMWI